MLMNFCTQITGLLEKKNANIGCQLYTQMRKLSIQQTKSIACSVIIISFFVQRNKKKQVSGNNLFLGNAGFEYVFRLNKEEKKKKKA
jgi:hypothetical protein